MINSIFSFPPHILPSFLSLSFPPFCLYKIHPKQKTCTTEYESLFESWLSLSFLTSFSLLQKPLLSWYTICPMPISVWNSLNQFSNSIFLMKGTKIKSGSMLQSCYISSSMDIHFCFSATEQINTNFFFFFRITYLYIKLWYKPHYQFILRGVYHDCI